MMMVTRVLIQTERDCVRAVIFGRKPVESTQLRVLKGQIM